MARYLSALARCSAVLYKNKVLEDDQASGPDILGQGEGS